MASYLALPEQLLGCTQSQAFYLFADDSMGNVGTVDRLINEEIGKQVHHLNKIIIYNCVIEAY